MFNWKLPNINKLWKWLLYMDSSRRKFWYYDFKGIKLYELATTSGWYEIMNKIDNVTNNLEQYYYFLDLAKCGKMCYNYHNIK